jgi:uncharacterized protein (TIGR04255 family)
MTINEVFPNPTVKRVIFQIQFPNLFYIENKIGDLQIKIMKEFPQSALLHRRQLVFVETGQESKYEDIGGNSGEAGKKIWQFKSKNNVELNILSNSLDISSGHHKTYNLAPGDKFRNTIEFVLNIFFGIYDIPVINRVGLRYIDECPIPTKTNQIVKQYYNTKFPLNKFDISNALEMDFKTLVKKGNYYLRYIESLQKIGNENKLILDFDGFANEITPANCLTVTDELHTIISNEYERTIKEPVFDYMRQR